MQDDITDFDEEVRQMFLTADSKTRELIMIALAIGLSRFILSKFSYWFSKEVKEDGED